MDKREIDKIESLPRESIDVALKNRNTYIKIEAKPDEHQWDGNIRRFKDVVIFIVALITAIIIAGFCVSILLNSDHSASAEKWATTVLGMIVSSLLTHLADRRTK